LLISEGVVLFVRKALWIVSRWNLSANIRKWDRGIYQIGSKCTGFSPLIKALSGRRQRCHGQYAHISFGKGRSDLGKLAHCSRPVDGAMMKKIPMYSCELYMYIDVAKKQQKSTHASCVPTNQRRW